MTDFQILFVPCHIKEAIGAAASHTRQLPSGARLFADLQDALDVLHTDLSMMNAPCLLMLAMPEDLLHKLVCDNKFQTKLHKYFTIRAGAEAEFMDAQIWVRMLPYPQQYRPPGTRSSLWAAFAREQNQSQEGAWAFGLRLCSGDNTVYQDPNFTVRLFAERVQAILALQGMGKPDKNDDIAIVTLAVLEDKANYALSMVRRFSYGYSPAANHLQALMQQSICFLELLKSSDITVLERNRIFQEKRSSIDLHLLCQNLGPHGRYPGQSRHSL